VFFIVFTHIAYCTDEVIKTDWMTSSAVNSRDDDDDVLFTFLLENHIVWCEREVGRAVPGVEIVARQRTASGKDWH